jgi:hypothetical protein
VAAGATFLLFSIRDAQALGGESEGVLAPAGSPGRAGRGG